MYRYQYVGAPGRLARSVLAARLRGRSLAQLPQLAPTAACLPAAAAAKAVSEHNVKARSRKIGLGLLPFLTTERDPTLQRFVVRRAAL